jgi:hypothetical protein
MKPLAFIAIVVFGLFQQPTKAPEPKGAVKVGSAQVADQANAGKDSNQPTAQTRLVPDKDDLKTQRELAWFTGALVIVSFLQFAALIVQACLFFRQTRIMDQHRVHLERLAIAASDNAIAAKEGAEAANKNAEFSKLNAEATEKSADAAKASADALINAERAWIMTELDWQDGHKRIQEQTVRMRDGQTVETSYVYLSLKGKNEGRTPAWITSLKFWCKLYTEAPPAKPDTTTDVSFCRLGPEPSGIGQPLMQNIPLKFEGKRPQTQSAIIIYGVVEYRDVFGEHETWCAYIVRGDPTTQYLERLAGYPEYNKNT